MTCLQSNTQNNSGRDLLTINSYVKSILIVLLLIHLDLSAMNYYSPLFEIDNVIVVAEQKSIDFGRSFSMSCTIAGIDDTVSLSIAYQWYKDEHPIQGATLPTLHFGALKLSDIGSYVCEVSIRSSSQRHGIIMSSVPYILNISSKLQTTAVEL